MSDLPLLVNHLSAEHVDGPHLDLTVVIVLKSYLFTALSCRDLGRHSDEAWDDMKM